MSKRYYDSFSSLLWAVEFTSVVLLGGFAVMAKSEAIKVGDKAPDFSYLRKMEGCLT